MQLYVAVAPTNLPLSSTPPLLMSGRTSHIIAKKDICVCCCSFSNFHYLRSQVGADPDQVPLARHTRVSSPFRLNPELHVYMARDWKIVEPSGSKLTWPSAGLGRVPQRTTIDTNIT